jgi:hypothetical protein
VILKITGLATRFSFMTKTWALIRDWLPSRTGASRRQQNAILDQDVLRLDNFRNAKRRCTRCYLTMEPRASVDEGLPMVTELRNSYQILFLKT